MPWSLSFGGLEVQANAYITQLRRYLDIDFLAPYSNDDFDVLHVVGTSVETARPSIYAKRKGKKVLISPVMYRDENLMFLKVMNLVFNKMPFPNWFKLNQEALNVADLILPNSNEEVIQIRKIFDLLEEKCRVLHNGVEDDLFKNVSPNLFYKNYRLRDFVLSCAMIDPRKNTLRLVKAFLESGIKTKLVLIGGYRPFNESYNREVSELLAHNKDKIVFLGQMKPKDPMMLSAFLGARLFALPSILETPGLSNLEAGLAGCRLLVGDCKPVREYFGDSAVYCDPKNIGDISRKMLNAYMDEDSILPKKIILEKYTWRVIARNLEKIYRGL